MRQGEATDQEVDNEEVIRARKVPRPFYVSERIGNIDGLLALSDENDPRRLLVLDLQEGIDRIAILDADIATSRKIGTEVRWINEFENKRERAEHALSAGRQFLTQENLKRLDKA